MATSRGPDKGRTSPSSTADLLDGYTRPALALARRLVADDQLAEDVVQEAFVAYCRNPAAFDAARGSFRSWFLCLVHSKAVDAVRREATRLRDVDAEVDRQLPEVVPDIAGRVTGRIADGPARTALAELSAVQREALVLAYWGGFTQREIAARTGAPLGTVKTRMLGGMRQLSAGLGAVVPAG